jgi:predicted kinase
MNGIIFIGPQASGKSTFYLQNFFSTHIRINLDMLKTRHRERIIFEACLQGKQPCVIDNTNPTKEERQSYLSLFKQYDFNVTGYFFDSVFEDCITRNNLRTGKAKVPEVGIKSTFKKMCIPTYDEGYTKLYVVKSQDNQFAIEEWAR